MKLKLEAGYIDLHVMKFTGRWRHFFNDDVVQLQHTTSDICRSCFHLLIKITEASIDYRRVYAIQHLHCWRCQIENIEECDKSRVDRVAASACMYVITAQLGSLPAKNQDKMQNVDRFLLIPGGPMAPMY